MWPSSGEIFTNEKWGIDVSNSSAVPITVGFSAHHAAIKEATPVGQDYIMSVWGENGYCDAGWVGGEVGSVTLDATGSVDGVDLPGTEVIFNGANTVGTCIAGDVFISSGFGVGDVTAVNGNAAVSTGGGAGNIHADGDVGFVLAGGGIQQVTAGGDIGIVSAWGDIPGVVKAGGYIGAVGGADLIKGRTNR